MGQNDFNSRDKFNDSIQGNKIVSFPSLAGGVNNETICHCLLFMGNPSLISICLVSIC